MKQYSLFIFDLDGTLMDSAVGEKVCYTHALNKLGYKFDPKDLNKFLKESFKTTFERFDDGRHKYSDFIKAFSDEARESMDDNTIPFTDTRPTILALIDRGIPLCIATRKSEERACAVLKNYGLYQYFDHIIGEDSVIHNKPDPECLFQCMSYYDIPKENTVFIGDTPNDMYAAKSAEIDGIFLDRNNECLNIPYVKRITTLTELIK